MIEISAFIFLIILSAFFSAAETALTAVGGHRIAHLVEMKKPGARTLRKLRENPAKLLSTILIGNNIVNISASVITTTMITQYFEKIGMGGVGAIIGIAIGFMTFVILVFGEITPKTFAIRNAEALALWLAPPLVVIEWVLSPVEWLFAQISRPLIFLLGGKASERSPFITEEEIKTLLFIGEKEGIIEKEERAMISGVFKFGDLTVAQVMTPRDKIAFVESGEPVKDAIARIKESGHSRLPVMDHNLDNILGVIYAKDLLNVGLSENAGEYIRQVLFIPAGKKVSDLLEQMQAEFKHLAMVVDEFGHTVGLVTLEDLVEEIVGEIHDEYEKQK